MLTKTGTAYWWLEEKCSTCVPFDRDCPFVEGQTVKETGDSPACSLYQRQAEAKIKG